MNKNIFLCMFVTVLIALNVAMYTKYVIFDGDTTIEFYIKWVPVFLLFLQTFYFSIVHKTVEDTKTFIYCLYSIFGFLFCMTGDIFLIFGNEFTYMAGMLCFLIGYVLFGVSRIYDIKKYVCSHHKWKIILGILVLLLAQCLFVPYLIISALFNKTFGNIPMIIAICVYSSFIIFSIFCNYISLIVFQHKSVVFSFVGVLLFGISDCLVILHDIKFTNVYLEACALTVYWTGLTILSWSVYPIKNQIYMPINENP